MQFSLPFSFVFKDPDWFKKLILTGLVTLIPVVGQIFLLGWMVEVIRRVINDDPVPLPDLDFGKNLGGGFKAWVVSLVYSLPLFIFILPINVVPVLATSLELDANTMTTVFAVVGLCCGGLALIYAILLAFMLPAAFGNLAYRGGIGDGLRVADVFGIVRSALVPFLLVIVGQAIATGLIAPLGALVCGVGTLLTLPYAMAIVGHFTGQAYKQALAARGQ
jgi:hypothetical protein